MGDRDLVRGGRLARLVVSGFKSFHDPLNVAFGPLTVLIGPNGSGKSNLLGALRLLAFIGSESLQLHVRRAGGASTLLHRGPSITSHMTIRVDFELPGETITYQAVLEYAANDTLFFADERVRARANPTEDSAWLALGSAHTETALATSTDTVARKALACLGGLKYFHFHDTSPSSPLRQPSRSENNRYLRADGVNLAAYLVGLQTEAERDERGPAAVAHQNILTLARSKIPGLKRLLPVVDSDVGAPGRGMARLDWVDDQDEHYGVHYLSDGSLRFLALVAALSQPASVAPLFAAIDEPELGLHPAALDAVVALARAVSHRCQVLFATHSPVLIDHVGVDEVVVVERVNGCTRMTRPDAEALSAWLDDYTLSELYDKNLLQGRP